MYGWGVTTFGGNGSDVLQETNVRVVTPKVCQDTLDAVCDKHFNGTRWRCTNLMDGMLCAGSLGKDTCQVKYPTLFQNICMQGDYDGSGQRSCKCNYVDFYKDARPLC